MLERCKIFILAVALGILLPASIIGILQNHMANKTDYEVTTDATTEYSNFDSLLIPVLMQDGSVRDMNLNEYLTGVVLREMPAKFEIESL